MSFSDYTGLLSAVASWMRRADLTVQIPDFISLAEAELNRRLRAPQMLSRTPLTISSETTALPADFLSVRSLRNTTTAQVLRAVSPETMDDDRATYDYSAGDPLRYCVEGLNLRVSPVPGDSVSASLLYYAALPALASSSTNWLLTLYPDAYLYAALLQGALYLRSDERVPMWSAALDRIVSEINTKANAMGGALDVQPSTYGAGAI
jgi:hypothetical protein